jgi:hypothetical protein
MFNFMFEQTVAGTMQAATIPSDLMDEAVWEHAAPLSVDDVMDERRKLPAPAAA